MKNTSAKTGRGDGLRSVAYWLLFSTALSLYAVVALAPKALTYLELKQQHYANQVELVSWEQQVEYLGKVTEALQHDPRFAEELARQDLDATRPGEERIAVDGALTLEALPAAPKIRVVPEITPWYQPLVAGLANNGRLRAVLLTISALTILAAFALIPLSDAVLSAEGADSSDWFAGLIRRWMNDC